jgi:topoisomerase-4 subunit A
MIAYFTKLKRSTERTRTPNGATNFLIYTKVVLRNTKLYVNKEEGFVGTSLKKRQYVTDCSDIDGLFFFVMEK